MSTGIPSVKVVCRLGLTVADGMDGGDEPDAVWCDAGSVRLIPLNTYTKVSGAIPWTAGNSVLDIPLDAEGYMTWQGQQWIKVLDLTSDRVNPSILPGKATHKVEFKGVKAGGVEVVFPSTTVRIAADTVDPVSGVCDLTILTPVPAAGGTPIVRGEAGRGIAALDLSVDGTGLVATMTDGTTTEAGLPAALVESDAQVAAAVTGAGPTRDALDAGYVRHLPPPSGDRATDDAMLRAYASTPGVNRLREGVYQISAPLPLVAGVQWEGVTPTLRQVVKSTGLWLADGLFEYEAGTVLDGGGTGFDAFSGHADDLPSLPPALGDTEIPGVVIRGIGFQGFRDGIRAGARNTMGLTHGKLDLLFFRECTGHGLRLTNFAHMTFGDARVAAMAGNASEGTFYFAADIPITTFQPGNSRFGELYAYIPPTSPKTRGICFHAQGDSGGGSMAHLDAQRVQCNRFGTPLIEQAATLEAGSSSVTVAYGAEFAVGMPVAFTTTVGSVKADLIYRVRSIAGNVLTVSPDSYSAVVTASTAGPITIRSYGMANIEWTVREAGSSHVSSNFLNLDSEGVVSAGVYVEKATLNWFGVGVVTKNCLANLVGRAADLCQWNVREPAVTDMDGDSSSSSYFGARAKARGFPLRGLWYDTSRLTNVLAIGNGTDHPTQNKGDLEARVGGFLYPHFGVGERYMPANEPALDFYGNECGNLVFSGGSAATWTLPTITSDSVTASGSQLGLWYRVLNVGTATVTLQTSGGQLVNKAAGKTSVDVPAGNSLKVLAVKDASGTMFWVAEGARTLA